MIEFIIPSMKGRENSLRMILSSLSIQTSSNWKARVIFDGEGNKLQGFQENITFENVKGPNKDWGHTPREFGKDSTKEEWIVMTGDDNYYVPVFVEEFEKFTNLKSVNFIYCNMLHNGYDYAPFDCKPYCNQIDIGCFAIRSDIAKIIPLSKTYAADGEFVEEYKKKYNSDTIIKIPKYLYVHN